MMPTAKGTPFLLDSHGRLHRKLRVQLTDACNFRCFYCMPEDARFLPPEKLLPVAELHGICRALVEMGVEEIRLTGGEPLVRPEFREIVTRLSSLPVRRFGLTTNGAFLAGHLDFLRDTRLERINVSLDSLRLERFNAITRSRRFTTVFGAIEKAHALGFKVKINCILLRGLNDDELLDFVEFSERTGIEVRFLEYMRVGPQYGSTVNHFLPADEAIGILSAHRRLNPVETERDATAFEFTTDKGGRVGFIASETKSFCHSCSRLRLTATGQLRACLFSERGKDLRGLSGEELERTVKEVMGMKPTGRLESISQPMNQIGG